MHNESIQKIESFIKFLGAEPNEMIMSRLGDYFSEGEQGDREVVYDSGKLIFVEAGKQNDAISLESITDRIVRFDGESVKETNPYAYIDQVDGIEIKMKGDDANKRKRRRSGNRDSGSSSNNNNNNNNNNNG